jgi:hypothetical protein
MERWRPAGPWSSVHFAAKENSDWYDCYTKRTRSKHSVRLVVLSPIPKVWRRNVLRKCFSFNEFGPSPRKATSALLPGSACLRSGAQKASW